MSTTHGIPRQSRPLRPGNDSADRSGRQRHIVLATMCAGMFLVQLDVTIVNVALPHIGEGLNTGLSGLQWVVDGYAVVLASLLLAGGTLGDRYGHKRLVLGGLVLFGAASVACALAPSAAALIAARALQGVGAAALLPGTLAVITRTTVLRFIGPCQPAFHQRGTHHATSSCCHHARLQLPGHRETRCAGRRQVRHLRQPARQRPLMSAAVC
jgi:sugar phosphate permease